MTHANQFCQGKPPAEAVAGERWTCPDCGREWERRLIWITVRTPDEQQRHEQWAKNSPEDSVYDGIHTDSKGKST